MIYQSFILLLLCSIPTIAQVDERYVRPEELEEGFALMWHVEEIPMWGTPTVNLLGIAVSPDGRYLAYVEDTLLKVKELPDGNEKVIAKYGYMPKWSPDSRYLKYYQYGNPGITFWEVNTNTRKTLRRGKDTSICYFYDTWAPDGNLYFINCHPDHRGLLSRFLVDSSLKEGEFIMETIENYKQYPQWPITTASYHIVPHFEPISYKPYRFYIVNDFNWEQRRTITIPFPDSTWEVSQSNSFPGNYDFNPMAIGPEGELYFYMTYRSFRELAHNNTPPFDTAELRARNASGWYRVDSTGKNLVQLVRCWPSGLGISITADGEKIYYGMLLRDSTCAVFEMDRWGRNKRQVTFPRQTASVIAERSVPTKLEVQSRVRGWGSDRQIVVTVGNELAREIVVEMYNTAGALVKVVKGRGAEVRIGAEGLASGMYTVLVSDGSMAASSRVLLVN